MKPQPLTKDIAQMEICSSCLETISSTVNWLKKEINKQIRIGTSDDNWIQDTIDAAFIGIKEA